ncbi:unnamed protein product [Spirodela intermedia]|uniref:Uncharacterized protein n=1 Tax=Spirodela intermedia TaxID=51605 RepID=A0A7I8ITS5_SPIIN|nr:unnamed protein product [Spirodela intermedia]CAA6661206.1 unnamed protein product [Spirodela intermedia]
MVGERLRKTVVGSGDSEKRWKERVAGQEKGRREKLQTGAAGSSRPTQAEATGSEIKEINLHSSRIQIFGRLGGSQAC